MNTIKEELAEALAEPKQGSLASAEIISDDVRYYNKVLEPFAVGKWVSVDERLPEFGRRSGVWNGYCRSENGGEFCGKHYRHVFESYVTHWLDLDLPSDKQTTETLNES